MLQLDKTEVIGKKIGEVSSSSHPSLRSFLEESIHSGQVYHGYEISVGGSDSKEIF